MLTLLLVASLCTPKGCGYADVTSRFPEASDDRLCIEEALSLNLQNAAVGGATRFACLEPAEYARLSRAQAF